jgi:hypothetical protein
MVIQAHDLNKLFLDAFGEIGDFGLLTGKWTKLLEYTGYWDGDAPSEYIAMVEFVDNLIDSYESNNKPQLQRVFALVERLLTEGSEQAKGIVTHGFLETLQTITSNKDYGYRIFEQYFGACTLAAWRQIELSWKGKSRLLDAIRSDYAAEIDPMMMF